MITEEQKRKNIKRIIELKTKLHKSDYKALKYAEGEITASDYAPILAQRREWRAEINMLEAQIATNNQLDDLTIVE